MAETNSEVEKLKAKMLKKSYYAMFRTIEDPSRLPPAMLEHYQWIIGLEKANLVLASGPLFRKDGSQGVGMTIFRADDFEHAESLAIQDPFVSAGAVSFDIQRWQINEGRVNVSIDFSDQQCTFS